MSEECKHEPRYVVKHGTRRTKFGKVQRYMCLKCYKKFSNGPLKYNSKRIIITEFLKQKYAKGYSSRKLVPLVKKKFNITLSYATILHWIDSKPPETNMEIEKELMRYNIVKITKRIDGIKNTITKLKGELKKFENRKRIAEKELREVELSTNDLSR